MKVVNNIIKNRLLEKNIKFRYNRTIRYKKEYKHGCQRWFVHFWCKFYKYNLDKINYYHYHNVKYTTKPYLRMFGVLFDKTGSKLKSIQVAKINKIY